MQGLIQKHGPLWDIAVRNPFVRAVHNGTMPREPFDKWLVQAYHLLDGHFAPMCRLLAAAPRDDRPLLLAVLEATRSECAWYRERIIERGLDPSAPVHPIVLALTNRSVALGLEPYVVGLVAIYAHYRTYADSWTARRAPSGPYREILRHWIRTGSSPLSKGYGRAVNRALAGATASEREAAEEEFVRVVNGKLAFWVMTLG
jgi:thiaminase